MSVTLEREGGIARVTFDKPPMNAWDRAMRREIVAIGTVLAQDDAVRGIVYTGAGARAFGAGQDLKEPPVDRVGDVDVWIDEWRALYDSLRGCPKPTVVALNGVAAGSSFQFAMLADARVAHPEVRMGQPEIRGGFASSMGPWVLSQWAGVPAAYDLALSGRMMDCAECQRRDLVTEVVAREEVVPAAMARAARLAEHPALTYALTKERLCALTQPGYDDTFRIWRSLMRRTIEAGSPAEA